MSSPRLQTGEGKGEHGAARVPRPEGQGYS